MILALRRLVLGTALLATTAFAQTTPVVAVPAATPAAPAALTPGMGTLVMDIAPFSSEIKLQRKVQAQLQSGGLEWGRKDGRIVFTLLNKRFVNFDIGQFTRYGTKTEMQLPAGDYQVTCVGFIPSTGFDVMKIVAKGAYFNENVMTVHVEAGKATTMALNPVIRKQSTFFVNVFMPDLIATTTHGDVVSQPVTLNALTPASVKWPAYTGDLKFQGTAQQGTAQ